MAGKVRFSRTAISDQTEIFNYWDNRNKSTTFSKKLKRLINFRCHQILDIHLAAIIQAGLPTSVPEVRYAYVRDYRIYFSFIDGDMLVLRIRDGRRDPERDPY